MRSKTRWNSSPSFSSDDYGMPDRREDKNAEHYVQYYPATEAQTVLKRSIPNVDEHNLKRNDSNDCGAPIWNPKLLQIRPVTGIFALAGVSVSMLVSLAILVTSNNQPVSSWSVQPTVYLAIASAAAAAAVRFAKHRAEPVAWWKQALHGTTIHALETQWIASQTLCGAARSFHRSTCMSAATILTALMIIDGVMLQRATSVTLGTNTKDTVLHVLLSPELPTGFSGIELGAYNYATAAALQTLEDYLKDTPLLTSIYGCSDKATCTGRILAPGLDDPHCTSRAWPITQDMLRSANATWGPFNWSQNVSASEEYFGASMVYFNSLFLIEAHCVSTDTVESQREELHIRTGQIYNRADNGSYILRNCFFRPAIVEYEVQIHAGRITLPSDMTGGRVIALTNNTSQRSTQPPVRQHRATMDALSSSLNIITFTNVSAGFLVPTSPHHTWYPVSGSFNSIAGKYYNFTDQRYGGLTFADPLPDVVATMNRLMFRGALHAARWSNVTRLIDPGLTPNQTIAGKQHLVEPIFVTRFRWLAGAAILDLLAVIACLPLFWGWWSLPPKLSQSPVEMAMVFRSPLVSSVSPHLGKEGVLAEIGDQRVAYGYVSDYQGRRLAIAEASQVTRPK